LAEYRNKILFGAIVVIVIAIVAVVASILYVNTEYLNSSSSQGKSFSKSVYYWCVSEDQQYNGTTAHFPEVASYVPSPFSPASSSQENVSMEHVTLLTNGTYGTWRNLPYLNTTMLINDTSPMYCMHLYINGTDEGFWFVINWNGTGHNIPYDSSGPLYNIEVVPNRLYNITSVAFFADNAYSICSEMVTAVKH
jgi:hypothetical protein